MAILVIAVQGFIIFMRTAAHSGADGELKAEAASHASQMLEELRHPVYLHGAVVDLQLQDDGSTDGRPNCKFTLSTSLDSSIPDFQSGTDARSANPIMKDGYTFVRHVDVIPTYLSAYRIQVRVWAAQPNAGSYTASAALPLDLAQPLAEVFFTQ